MVETLITNLIPPNEARRLSALRELDLLYTASEQSFDNITQMMAQVFGTPMAFISLVDEDLVYYKSKVGPFPHPSVKREDSLCSLTILGNQPLVIEDALLESCLTENPYVATEGGIRFYAGAPLIAGDGIHIGTACIVDTRPRSFSEGDKKLLERFASMVMHEIDVRKALLRQAEFEDQLSSALQELQFVTDTMPQLVWATEPDGYSFFFNQGWLRYTGLSFNDVKGNGWTQSLHPDDHDAAFAAWTRAVETGNNYDVEYRLRRHDGAYRWFVARGTPMRNGEGQIVKWYGTSTDIDDQKRTQEDLRQSKERFDLVSKATQDAIWDWNLETDETWWNEGFRKVFGYPAEEIEPTIVSWYNRVHPDDKERVVNGIHAVIDKGEKQWSDEYRFRKKDGSYAMVFDRGHVLHNASGAPYRMLGSMQDITMSRQQQSELQRSEQRFQAAVSAVQGHLWTNSAEGRMEGEQRGWEALTGQAKEEYQGYGWACVVHPDDAQPTIDAWNEAVREQRTFVFEHRLRTKNGQYRLFSIRAVPIFEESGAIREWVGVHTDVNEQRLAEEMIRRSEQRFQNLIRETTVGIIILTGEAMHVEVVNDAYARLIGRQAEQLLHRNLFEIIPEAEAVFRPLIEEVLRTEAPLQLYDQPYQVRSGEGLIEGFLNLVYQPYREADGRTTGVMVLCHDVTEQVLARRKVEEAETTARLAIASAELGTFDVNLKTNDIITSERMDAIFDVAHQSERSRYISALHPDDQVIRKEAYERANRSGILEYEARVVQKDETIRWIRVKGKVTFDKEGQPEKLAGVVQDITEEKKFADELTRQVKQRTAELEQFTYVSHHDLQEPLRKISMFTEMVLNEQEQVLSPSGRNRLEKVLTSARRMSTALRDVLNFASLNKQELFTAVDLNVILSDVQVDLELTISEKNATLQIDALPTVAAVPHQMHQLFYNLLNNALKFSRSGAPAHINIRSSHMAKREASAHIEGPASEHYHHIAVADNGIGFDLQQAEKIFGLFQRLHSRDTYSGTGIGLALCKKIATQHGGAIWAESAPGTGATFHLLLPA